MPIVPRSEPFPGSWTPSVPLTKSVSVCPVPLAPGYVLARPCSPTTRARCGRACIQRSSGIRQRTSLTGHQLSTARTPFRTRDVTSRPLHIHACAPICPGPPSAFCGRVAGEQCPVSRVSLRWPGLRRRLAAFSVARVPPTRGAPAASPMHPTVLGPPSKDLGHGTLDRLVGHVVGPQPVGAEPNGKTNDDHTHDHRCRKGDVGADER